MNALLILITILLAGISCIRLSRWLGFLQEKEYRFDRLRSFIFSGEGVRELVRILPRPRDFTRTGLKRPKPTARILLVGVTAMFLLGLVVLGLWFGSVWFEQPSLTQSQFFVLSLVALYICIPLVVIIASLPFVSVSIIQTLLMLWRAQRLLAQHKPYVIGVTGSYGKTTTKQLLAHVLGEKTSVFVTPKSFNTRYSVAKSIVEQYRGQATALLEYGAYGRGEIAYLTKWFAPSMAIITGLTAQHLGLFGSIDAIVDAKSELIAALEKEGVVIYNAADPQVKKIVTAGVAKWRRRQQTKQALRVLASDPAQSEPGYRYDLIDGYLRIRYQKHTVVTSLIGMHTAQTVELVARAAVELGLTPLQVLARIESFSPSSAFIQRRETKQGAVIIDDAGTSNVVGFQAALTALATIKAKQKYLITAGIVDLGKESDALHRKLAQQAKTIVDEVWFVGWQGRQEFMEEFESHCMTEQSVIRKRVASLKTHDALLVEGRMPGWIEGLLQ